MVSDVNWSKTEFMFISNLHQKINETEIIIHEREYQHTDFPVKVVNQFKLLGITLDNKLNFSSYATILKRAVQKKLFSIKRLFYLSTSVKLQFFKTFISPHFDYCATLYVYFSNQALQKITNLYNYCIAKLLRITKATEPLSKIELSNHHSLLDKLKLSDAPNLAETNRHNNQLERYGLQNFHHRLLSRVLTFSHKIINEEHAPGELQNILTHKPAIYNLRKGNNIKTEFAKKNKFGEKTFSYFFPKLINNTILKDLVLPFEFFKLVILNNINILLIKSIPFFPFLNFCFPIN